MSCPKQILICGAGAAGMSAAIAASRAGSRVWLLEASSRTGGTVANVLLHTVGGLFDGGGNLLNGGLSQELVERLSSADPLVRRRRLGRTWVLNVCPDVYRAATLRWLQEQPNLTVMLNARVSQVVARDGHVVAAEIVDNGTARSLAADAYIDTTGTAELARLIAPSAVEDNEDRAAGGLVVRLDHVRSGSLEFPKGLALVRALRAAAVSGELPKELAHAWIDSGVRENEAYLKLMIPLSGDWREPSVRVETERSAHAQAHSALAFLRKWPGFTNAEAKQIGELGIRDGGRVRGEYCLTANDVLQGRRFDDAACKCSWPIEFWDGQHGVLLEYLASDYYEIPLRALRIRGIDNLWVAGKCLSADRQAQASARIAGTCWAMGEAVGRAAAS